MARRQFQFRLDNSTYVVVDLLLIQGHVVSFVVRLMAVRLGGDVNVARYDTAHGMAHRDELGARIGLVRKVWFPDRSPAEVFSLAIADFKSNYENYLANFDRN